MPLHRMQAATGFELFQESFVSSLSRLANSVQADALRQMQSDSQKTYGLDDTDYVLQETNGNPGIRWLIDTPR